MEFEKWLKLAILTSKIKGFHIYRKACERGDTLVCEPHLQNLHSNNAIKVTKQEEIVGHDTLARVLALELMTGTILRCIDAIVTGEPRDAPEGKWVLGGGSEIPCCYKVYGFKKNKSEIRKKDKKCVIVTVYGYCNWN